MRSTDLAALHTSQTADGLARRHRRPLAIGRALHRADAGGTATSRALVLVPARPLPLRATVVVVIMTTKKTTTPLREVDAVIVGEIEEEKETGGRRMAAATPKAKARMSSRRTMRPKSTRKISPP
jgi:hypothetical protein